MPTPSTASRRGSANEPTTPTADRILEERGIASSPTSRERRRVDRQLLRVGAEPPAVSLDARAGESRAEATITKAYVSVRDLAKERKVTSGPRRMVSRSRESQMREAERN